MKWLVLGDIGRSNLYHVGDEAMAEAAVDALHARGATAITLVATHAQTATDLYGLPAVARIGIGPAWDAEQREEVLARARSGRIEAGTALAELDAAVAATDAVLISGGGNMSSHYAHHIDERAVLTRLARRHGTPLIVAAQTIGPHLSRRDRALVAEIIDHAGAFAVRDDQSYHLALELGGDPARVHRINDDAIMLEPREEDTCAANALVAAHGRYIVASFTSTAGTSGLDRHEYLDLAAATLDRLAQDTGADVLLLPHLASHFEPVTKYDQVTDTALVARSGSGRIHTLPAVPARVAVAITAGACLSVSSRYHPVVLAPAHGVPAIGLSLSDYSTVRMRGAMEPAGLESFLLGPTSWEAVAPAAQELLGRPAEFRARLNAVARARRERQQTWWDHVTDSPSSPQVPGTPPHPAEQIPATGAWAAPAARALTQFDALDAARRELADTRAELQLERDRVRGREADLTRSRRQIAGLTRRAERAENRRAVRMMDRLGALRHAGKKAARASTTAARALLTSRATPAQHRPPLTPAARQPGAEPNSATAAEAAPPLVSVLIPLYNVAEYLEACLSSVVGQTLTDLEIILIDDGSTDSSPAIAARYAAADDRIRLIRQENRGLGAVRNRGVQLARGKYLTFVDSDDTLPRHSLRTLVEPLERSGADLCLGGIARLLPDGTYRTRQWVRDLHACDRTTSVAAEPELLRDFYTWNKVYRTDFFKRNGFRFREGTLFEDQPVVTEILCCAAAIEVIAKTTYHYRIRPDDSALTGSMYTVANIRARHRAVALTREALTAVGAAAEIRRGWLWTLAEYHFPGYLKHAVGGTEEHYEAVRAMIADVLTPAGLPEIPGVSAANRVLCHLALTTDRATVLAYLEQTGASTSHAPLQRGDGQTFATLPVPRGAEVPRALTAVSTREQRLVTILDDHHWPRPGLLELQVRVGMSQTLPPQEVGVSVFLAPQQGAPIDLSATGTLEEQLETPRGMGVPAWYSLRIRIDIAALQREHHDALTSPARIEVEVRWDEHTRCAPLGRRHQVPAALEMTGSVLPGSTEATELQWSRQDGLSLRLVPRAVTATGVRYDGARLALQVHSHLPGFDVVFIAVKAAGEPERRTIVRRTAPGEYRVEVDLAWVPPDRRAHLIAIDDRGRRRNVHVANPGPAGARQAGLTTTPGARLQLRPTPEDRQETTAPMPAVALDHEAPAYDPG